MPTYTVWSENEIQQRARKLRVLQSPLRLRILAALAEADSTVWELERHLPVSQPLLSWHLGLLRQAGFVTAERVGREMRYRLCPLAFQELYRDLDLLVRGTTAE